jgi:hypothetical protein
MRIRLFVAIAMAVSLTAAGCSSDSDDAPQVSDTSATSNSVATVTSETTASSAAATTTVAQDTTTSVVDYADSADGEALIQALYDRDVAALDAIRFATRVAENEARENREFIFALNGAVIDISCDAVDAWWLGCVVVASDDLSQGLGNDTYTEQWDIKFNADGITTFDSTPSGDDEAFFEWAFDTYPNFCGSPGQCALALLDMVEEYNQLPRPITIETDADFSSEPIHGTFEVTEGADILGCSNGTYVDTPPDNQFNPSVDEINKVMTCSEPDTGTFTIAFVPDGYDNGPGVLNGPWRILNGVDDFADLQGEGDHWLVMDGPKSGVETYAGNIEYTLASDNSVAEATVTVRFSGDACTYTGASTFDVGTELTIEVMNLSERSFGFSVWKVPDGTTLADIEARGIQEVGGDRSENNRGILRPGSVESRDLMVLLDEAGTWGMDCFTLLPGTIQTDEEYAAVVVEVR